ncbi:MAG: hypothetical protein RML74_09945 [Acidobacteriota bacterium]|nr:hypothetical protein [Acidobacteriota bacterium]
MLTEVEQRPGRRKAIVVMTDGVDNSIRQPWLYPTEHTFEELLARVQESDVLIYPIYLDTEYEMVVRQRRESPMSYAVARRQLSGARRALGWDALSRGYGRGLGRRLPTHRRRAAHDL